MIMNEYRLNPLDPNSQKIMERAGWTSSFFGPGREIAGRLTSPQKRRAKRFHLRESADRTLPVYGMFDWEVPDESLNCREGVRGAKAPASTRSGFFPASKDKS